MLTTAGQTDRAPDSIFIHCGRLVLREFTANDFPQVQQYLLDSETLRYFRLPWNAEGPQTSRRFIEGMTARRLQAPRCYFDLAIARERDGTLLGGCGLYIFSEENHEGSIHYWLARRFWSRGYATEAAKTLLWLGFERVKLHRIFAICDFDNTASSRVLEKAGMRREGELREHLWHNNSWRSSYLYAALAHQWKHPEADTLNDNHMSKSK